MTAWWREGKAAKSLTWLIVWHSTFYQAPGFVVESLPPYGFIWICLNHSPFLSLILLSYFSCIPPIIHLDFRFSSLILTCFHPPHTSHPSPPPSLLPLTHIIYLPFLPLPISPSLTSCSPACQTAIINGETIVPLALGSHLHWLA